MVLRLALLAALATLASSCIATTVAGTAVKATTTVVGATVHAGGAVIGAVTPGDDDDDD